MSDSPPDPPAELPANVIGAVGECSLTELEALTQYAEALAAYRSKASTTIKEINGNRYYYWQWRDGDQVRSQYKRPVEPNSEN